MLTVLRALAANDDRIIEYFRAISRGRRGTGGIIDFSADGVKGVSLDSEKFISSIGLNLWSRLAKLAWRPFDEAREFVRGLELKSVDEWKKFCRGLLSESGILPNDIPAYPNETYRTQGWKSWGDWLGTGTVAPFLREYRPFEEAREFARGLGLTSQREWGRLCKGLLSEKGVLPDDIPAKPDNTYKNQGWKGMGDWLGTGTVAPFLREYRPFEEAREFARGLGLKNVNDWKKFCRDSFRNKESLPNDIPAYPNETYRTQGWKSWGDWLGTETVATFLRKYRPFEQARIYAHDLKLNNQDEWRQFYKGLLPEKGELPTDIPRSPNHTYRRNGWKSWGDWLGTGTVASQLREYRTFEQARKFVHSLRLRNRDEWKKFCKGLLRNKEALPSDIPSAPQQAYRRNGWKSWGDWLGTGTVASQLREYRTFEQARKFVHSLRLRNRDEWKKFCKGLLPEKGELPTDVPANPDHVYKSQGWQSMGDWLGTETVATFLRQRRPFEEARKYARGLGLKSQAGWRKFCKGLIPEKGELPSDIPLSPADTYKNQGWKGWGDWLGTGTIANFFREFRLFEEAREYVQGLGLRNKDEWQKLCKGLLPEKGELPSDIPTTPNRTYKTQGWQGWGDWLGTGTIAPFLRKYRAFEEARKYIHGLELANRNEWRKFCKGLLPKKGLRPNDIPSNPSRTYKNQGWKNWADWLGKK